MSCGVRNDGDRSRYRRSWQPLRRHVKSWALMTAAATLLKASQLLEVSKLRTQLLLLCWVSLTTVCVCSVLLLACQSLVMYFELHF